MKPATAVKFHSFMTPNGSPYSGSWYPCNAGQYMRAKTPLCLFLKYGGMIHRYKDGEFDVKKGDHIVVNKEMELIEICDEATFKINYQ